MQISPTITLSIATIYNVLEEDGVVVLPSKLGYGILALSSAAVEKFYLLKNRALDRPSGILATPEIFSKTTCVSRNFAIIITGSIKYIYITSSIIYVPR